MSFFANVFIGLPFVYLGTALVVGGFDNANMLIAMSVICTAGVGLVFWIPVCWITGFIVSSIATAVFNVGGGGSPSIDTPEQARMNALERYLRQQRRRGGSLDDAADRLREEGWDEDRIRRAVENVTAWD